MNDRGEHRDDRPSVLYASFDEVPGPKGAGRHIDVFVRALGDQFGNVLLVSPGRVDHPIRAYASGVHQIVLGCPDGNPIGRARTFRAKLARLVASRSFDVIHFRSIFEGIALIDDAVRRSARLIYEVNGFPSIEMKYHYRSLMDDELLNRKLSAQENECLSAVDQIITVSEVNRRAIEQRGVSSAPITVIPNGVDLSTFPFRLSSYWDSPARPAPTPNHAGDEPDRPLCIGYVGTLTAWQGIEVAIEAVALLLRDRPVRLDLLGVASKSRMQSLRRLTERLRIEPHVHFHEPVDLASVCSFLHEVDLVVVPLLAVDRNTQQGCCPLKLLEAMAAGCPVVASDLPVVRELAVPNEHYFPTRAGDARNLKNGVLELISNPTRARRMAQSAREHVASSFSWKRATDRLIEVYVQLNSPGPIFASGSFSG